MEKQTRIEQLICPFCGYENEFPYDKVYSNEGGETKLIQKYCKNCSEELIKYCPVCGAGIIIKDNLDKEQGLRIDLEGFNTPTPSPIDDFIPQIRDLQNTIDDLIKPLTPEKCRQYGLKWYLDSFDKYNETLKILYEKIRNLQDYCSAHVNLDLNKDFIKIIKKINKNIEIYDEINKSRTDQNELADSNWNKKLFEKQIIKNEWKEELNKLLDRIEDFRASEKKQEIESYQPGLERVKKYFRYDPTFYRLICPKCKTKLYIIESRIFLFKDPEQQYENAINLNSLLVKSNYEPIITEHSNAFNFEVIMHISKQNVGDYELHADYSFTLGDGETLTFGRNEILDLPFKEPEADDLLFEDEGHLLSTVSRTQLTFIRDGDKLYIKAQEYQPNKTGTYLNDLDSDIRKEPNQKAEIGPGDKILIPFSGELNNDNIIEIIFKK